MKINWNVQYNSYLECKVNTKWGDFFNSILIFKIIYHKEAFHQEVLNILNFIYCVIPGSLFVTHSRVSCTDPEGCFGSVRLHERAVSLLYRRNQPGWGYQEAGLWSTCCVWNTRQSFWYDQKKVTLWLLLLEENTKYQVLILDLMILSLIWNGIF